MEPDLYPLVTVLEGVMKNSRKDSAEQQSCHEAGLLCAVVDREQVRNGSFINNTPDHTIMEGVDDVNNLVTPPYRGSSTGFASPWSQRPLSGP